MINYNVIDDKYNKENNKIEMTFNDDKGKITIILRNKIIINY